MEELAPIIQNLENKKIVSSLDLLCELDSYCYFWIVEYNIYNQ